MGKPGERRAALAWAWPLLPRPPGPLAGPDKERPLRLSRTAAQPPGRTEATGREGLGEAAGRPRRRAVAAAGDAARSGHPRRAHQGSGYRPGRCSGRRDRAAPTPGGQRLQLRTSSKVSAALLGAGRGLGGQLSARTRARAVEEREPRCRPRLQS